MIFRFAKHEVSKRGEYSERRCYVMIPMLVGSGSEVEMQGAGLR